MINVTQNYKYAMKTKLKSIFRKIKTGFGIALLVIGYICMLVAAKLDESLLEEFLQEKDRL